MKFRISFLSALLLLPLLTLAQVDRTQAPAAGPAPEIMLGHYEQFVLDNGLQVFVVENHKIPRVAISLSLDVVPPLEGDKVGAIEIAGDLMRRGTTTRDKATLDREVDFIGARLVSSGSGMYGASLKKHLGKLMELFADVALNPAFAEEELEKLRKENLSSLKASENDANSIAGNIEARLDYGAGHPYGEIVTKASLEAISVEDCKAIYKTYFRPNVAYLIIVGDINLAEARELANKYLSSWESADVPTAELAPVSAPEKNTVAIADKAGAVQTVLTVAYPLEFSVQSPDFLAARLANQMLGGSFGARLNQNLREDHGYTYGARSSVSGDKYMGSFSASASVRNEVTDSALTELMYEIRKAAEEGFEPDELKKAKSILNGSFARALESPQTIARFALNSVRYGLADDFYSTYLQRLDAVTLEEVNAAAKKYFRPDHAHLIAVGDAAALSKKLAAFGPIQEYDAYANPVSAVDVAALEGMDVGQIMDNYIAAIGGKEKVEAVKSIEAEGSIEVQGQQIQLYVAKKAPGKILMSQVMPAAFGGGTNKPLVCDGTDAVRQGRMGAEKVEGDDLKEVASQASIFFELDYEALGYSAELTGVKKVDDRDSYTLEFSPSWEGDKMIRNYDVETGQLLQYSSGGQTTTYSDYREVDGISISWLRTLSSPMGTLEMTVSDVRINPELDDSIFEIE